MRKLTNDEFIERSNRVHNNLYLYTETKYTKSSNRVKIICKEHGVFEQEANSHLMGSGCSKCSGVCKLDNKSFIKKSNIIHNDLYDYSKVKYINAFSDVIIICKNHGEFLQRPNNHLSGYGCNKCGQEDTNSKNSKKLEEFISDCKKKHGEKYNYSLVEYINAKTKVRIICNIHGVFEQMPGNHLNSAGCKKCSADLNKKRMTKTTEEFISDCKKTHGEKYDYSLVKYTGTNNKIKIICSSHGIFEQRAYKHIQSQGCPTCSESKLEREIRLYLTKNHIEFKIQYGKKSDDIYLNGQKLDFYLPNYKIGIECQGDQHFMPVDFGNKGNDFSYMTYMKNISRDIKKKNICNKYGIKIIYYCGSDSYYDFTYEYLGEIFSDIKNLFENLCKKGQ